MNTLDKYKLLKENQKKERKEADRIAKEESSYRSKERKSKYNRLVELIDPFDKEKLEGHKISLKFHNQDNQVDLFIDGKFYVTFSVETNYHSCNCSECADGGYGHEGHYTHDLEIYKWNENNEKVKGPYFSWYGRGEDEENVFVQSMDKLIKDYDNDCS